MRRFKNLETGWRGRPTLYSMSVVKPQSEYLTAARIAAVLGLTFGEVQRAITQAGIVPALSLNDVGYFASRDLVKIRAALTAGASRRRPTPLLTGLRPGRPGAQM